MIPFWWSGKLKSTVVLFALLVFLVLGDHNGGVDSLSFGSVTKRSRRILKPTAVAKTQLQSTSPSSATSDEDIEKETLKATKAMESCSKAAFVAGGIDVTLNQVNNLWDKAGSTPEILVMCIWTLWKLSFGANLWFAASVQRRKFMDPATDEATKVDVLSRFLQTMTWIWRQSAIVIVLADMFKIISIWRTKIPNIQQVMSAVLAATLTGTVCTSTIETRQLFASSADNKKSDEKVDKLEQSLRKESRVTARAMALSISALGFRVASIVFLSITSGPLWKMLYSMSELLTPLGIAVSLKTLRASFLVGLPELIQSFSQNKKFAVNPETQYQFSLAETKFYNGARKAFVSETVVKLLAEIVAWVTTATATM